MGLFSFMTPPDQQSTTRRYVTHGALFGGGIVGAGTVMYSIVEVVRANPDKGFVLLERWGPWFFLALFAVWAVNGLLNRFLDVFSDLGGRFAGSMDRIADEQVKLAGASRDQAEAMQRSADREDRDQERMSTLIDYAGQQGRQAAEAAAATQAVVLKLAEQVEHLASKKDGTHGRHAE